MLEKSCRKKSLKKKKKKRRQLVFGLPKRWMHNKSNGTKPLIDTINGHSGKPFPPCFSPPGNGRNWSGRFGRDPKNLGRLRPVKAGQVWTSLESITYYTVQTTAPSNLPILDSHARVTTTGSLSGQRQQQGPNSTRHTTHPRHWWSSETNIQKVVSWRLGPIRNTLDTRTWQN